MLALLCVGVSVQAGDGELAPPKGGGKGKKEATVAELLNTVRTSRDPETQINAIRKLGEVTTPDDRDNQVTTTLLSFLEKKKDPFVRRAIIRAEGRLQASANPLAKIKFIPVFTDILKNNKEVSIVRESVAEVFRDSLDPDGLPDRKAFDVLLAIAGDKKETNLSLRSFCILASGAFGSAEALPILSGIFNEPDSSLKADAAQAIFDLLDKKPELASKDVSVPTVMKFVEMLGDEKLPDDLRVAVIQVVAQLLREGNAAANKSALEKIIEIMIKSTNDRVVIAAIEALGKIGTPQSVEPLGKTYVDYDPKSEKPKDVEVRAAIMRALQTVLVVQLERPRGTDAKAVKEAIKLLVKAIDDDKSSTVKLSAVYALGYLYDDRFSDERKDPVLALIYLGKASTADDIKAAVADTLIAITGRDFKQKWDDWEKYWDKTYKK